MAGPQPASQPEPAPAQPQPGQPAQPDQLGVGLADTPAGQRLAVQVTVLLTADEAKAFAAVVADVASSMSTSGLIIANGGMTSR